MDGNGDTEAKNVIRLPRDWVGPPEELVPLGSRAREGRSAEDDDHGDVIPDAEDFWGEAASAVHHVMRAPTETPTTVRARRLRGLPRWPRVRRRTAVIAAVVGVIAVVAILGVSEGHGPRATASATAAARAPVQKPATRSHAATPRQSGSDRAARSRTRAVPVRAFSERPSARHVVTRWRHAARGASSARHATTRHQESMIATPVTTPVAPTPTVASPTTSTVVPTTTTATTARAGTTTSAASTKRSPSAGPTGPGEAINCNPKCS
jgi:hypothetical protein